MKKIFALSLVLTGMLFFCACEKEMIQPDPKKEDVSSLKAADSKGMTKTDANLPMWARMASGSPNVIPTTNDMQYGVIIFYVADPAIIPDDWDFYPNNWLAPPMLFLPEELKACEGSEWWLPDMSAPHHYHLKGKGDVIVWIITYDQVLELLARESITIPELAACEPLVGHAHMYNEVLRPVGGGAPVFGGEFNGHGYLEDGRKFILKLRTILKPDEPLKTNNMLQIIDK